MSKRLEEILARLRAVARNDWLADEALAAHATDDLLWLVERVQALERAMSEAAGVLDEVDGAICHRVAQTLRGALKDEGETP